MVDSLSVEIKQRHAYSKLLWLPGTVFYVDWITDQLFAVSEPACVPKRVLVLHLTPFWNLRNTITEEPFIEFLHSGSVFSYTPKKYTASSSHCLLIILLINT